MRKPYWRNAIEIDPYRKELVPICRFECRKTGGTFSLLPIQLIPYHQYTVAAIISMVVLAITLQSQGKAGCEKSAEQADSLSSVTPFLVWCWLKMTAAGMRRAHRFLDRTYNLSQVRSGDGRAGLIAELTEYLKAIAGGGTVSRFHTTISAVGGFAKATGRFLFGQPSQQRIIDTV